MSLHDYRLAVAREKAFTEGYQEACRLLEKSYVPLEEIKEKLAHLAKKMELN